MAAPIHQKEVVRLLSIEHGMKEAARLSNVPYDVVRQWSVRGKWKQSQSVTSHPVKVAADRVASEHALNREKSRIALGKYAVKASESALKEKKPLKVARSVRDVAAIHSTLWPEDHNERGILNVQVLAGQVALKVSQ